MKFSSTTANLIILSITGYSCATPIKANLEHAESKSLYLSTLSSDTIQDASPSTTTYSTLVPSYIPTGTKIVQPKPSEIRIFFGNYDDSELPNLTSFQSLSTARVLSSVYVAHATSSATVGDYKLAQ